MSSPSYWGTPLATKLGYKPGFVAHLNNAPDDYAKLVDPMPDDVTFTGDAAGANLVHFFTKEAAELAECLHLFLDAIHRDGMIWVSWPKRASKVSTDMTEDVIREIALPLGLVDIKVCAVDDVWSGLKLVIRKELR